MSERESDCRSARGRHSRIRWQVGVGALTLGMVAAACGSSSNKASSGTTASSGSSSQAAAGGAKGSPIVIGVVAAFSGSFGAYGSADLAGIKAEVNLVNKAGGVLGHPLEVKSYDDQSDPSKATIAAQTLLSSGTRPLAVHAGAVSVDTAPIIQVTNRAKVISFTPSATPAFANPKQSPYTYVVYPSSDLQVGLTAQGIKTWAGSNAKVGILGSNDTGGKAIVSAMQSGLPKLGLNVVGTQYVSGTATDFTSEIQALKSDGATVLFEQFATPAAFVTAENNLATVGWNVKTVAGSTAVTATVLTSIPSSQRANFVALATSGLVRPKGSTSIPTKIQPIVNELKASGANTDLLLEELNGADEVNFVVWAVKQANSIDPTKVNQVIEGTSKNPVPPGTFLQIPSPAYSSSNHGLQGANFTNYWALAYPSTPIDGTFEGAPFTASS